MTDQERPSVGSIGWLDLTVDDAEGVRDFYAAVVGWKPQPVDMGDYHDFCMASPDTDEPRAGVCHAHGANADLPPVWMVYFNVADIDAGVAKCTELGGEVVTPIKSYGGQGRYCVIKDPAGAFAALYEPA